ncbi:hypothetical protein AB9H26_15530 [Yersinia enterocolitica]|uniref:hypothetical protein n=1 Tax=Yersinia enterocolitica TaxID=630 RepID=UPI003310813A|nr:hypothetical protein [Yersinia enterocolitica]
MKILSASETKYVSGSHSIEQSIHALDFFSEKGLWPVASSIIKNVMGVSTPYAKFFLSPDITISTDSHNVLATSETNITINNALPRG